MPRETDGGRWPRIARIRRVIRRILGAPDYQAYLEHCRRAGHEPQLTEREYVAQVLESTGTAGRCC